MADYGPSLVQRAEAARRAFDELLQEYKLADRDADTYETTAREALGLLSRVLPVLEHSAMGAEVQAFLERHGAEHA